MPELLVRAIDDVLAERIKRYTRSRGLPLNQIMLELLAAGLDAVELKTSTDQPTSNAGNTPLNNMPSIVDPSMRETRILGGTWNSDEASAFRDALKFLEKVPNAPHE